MNSSVLDIGRAFATLVPQTDVMALSLAEEAYLAIRDEILVVR